MHIATAAGGVNLTLSELLRQQKFLEAFDLVPEVVPMADGAKILSAIFSGSIDLSPMSGIGQVFPAVERGADLTINLDFHVQNEMLPFDRVVDLSLARNAQKLLT